MRSARRFGLYEIRHGVRLVAPKLLSQDYSNRVMTSYPIESSINSDIATPRQITLSYLRPNNPLPLVVRPAVKGLDLVEWSAGNVAFIENYLLRNGAILFRGFGLKTPSEFERMLTGVAGPLLDYSYRSTPRHVISGKIFSSTEYPAHQSIPLHNENSYSRSWPMKLAFFSLQVAEQEAKRQSRIVAAFMMQSTRKFASVLYEKV